MKKFFDIWNILKQKIHNEKYEVFFRERDIFFTHLGKNVGTEQNGKGEKFLRPVLILKKFGKESAFVVPLSTKIKDGRFYFQFTSSENILSTALLSQSRILDTKRLLHRSGMISEIDFLELKKKLGKLLGIL